MFLHTIIIIYLYQYSFYDKIVNIIIIFRVILLKEKINLLNYIKFAIYQLIGFILSIPLLIKVKINPNKFESYYIFKFLQNHAKNSLKIVNINLTVLGLEKLPDEPVLFVINHSSMLDSFILMSCVDRPIGCIIADEPIWKNLPIVNKWAKLTKCIYIDRKNIKSGMKSIYKASDNILQGHSMAVFPEGDLTWIKNPNALISDFRNGSLKIAYKANCPIVPLVIKNSKYTYSGYKPIGKIKSIPVEVEFLDPIYDHIKDPNLKSKALGDEIKNKMIDAIKSFNIK